MFIAFDCHHALHRLYFVGGFIQPRLSQMHLINLHIAHLTTSLTHCYTLIGRLYMFGH